jgi:hypothetical protein
MIVGLALFVHSGLSAMDYFNHLKEDNAHGGFVLPMDLMAETIAAALMFLWGWLGSRSLLKIKTKES